MSQLRLLLIALCILVPAWAGHHFVAEHEAKPGDTFMPLFEHLMPAPLVSNPESAHAQGPHYLLEVTIPGPAAFDADAHMEGTQIVATNLQLFQIAAVLLLFVCFSGVPGHLRTGKGDYVSRLFAGFALWLRDDVVYPAMGRKMGAKFLPYFLALFFFILFMNLLGLVPGAATATASVFVTGGLALFTLLVMVFGGMIVQGPFTYWKTLVPHVPVLIWPIMFAVEFIGIFVKPFALMIRLFANMTGGHMVVLSFMGLLFLMANMAGHTAAFAASPVLVGFAVFIMIIEAFVALLQAYVFTMLSVMFIQSSLHPDH
ncbi:MAG: F0F1 ATP synthase subunit A [Planctomycetes bacterium]|nr:F0F1 ATP synthase subunit A [Planctomycetota bacterium]